MSKFLDGIYRAHEKFWIKENIVSVCFGLVFFAVALIFQHIAYNYIDYHINATPVGDILLNNLPTLDLDAMIVEGSLLVTLVIMLFHAAKPKYLPFSIKSLSLFLIIRSFFISLTHLGA